MTCIHCTLTLEAAKETGELKQKKPTLLPKHCSEVEMRWRPESHVYSAKLENSENGTFNPGPDLGTLRQKESSVTASCSSQPAPE